MEDFVPNWNFFTFFEKNFEENLHSSNITPTFAPSKGNNATPDDKTIKIALWCNGSTSDSGSACEGSNPSKATK